jgi:monoamine oxidase
MTDETIFIIGGGIAGLYCANILVERGFNVSVFEKQSKFGGRIKTVYDKKNPNSVCYESGPWRVHPSHKKFLSLIEKLGLHVIPTYHKVHYKKFPKERKRNMSNNNLSVKEMSLTLFQAD